MKSHLSLYCLLTFCPFILAAQQQAIITSTDHILTVGNTRYLSYQVNAVKIDSNTNIRASDGTVTFSFSFQGRSGHFRLPGGKQIQARDILSSTYCMLDTKDSFFVSAFELLKWFMKTGEKPHEYKKRVGQEIGGSLRIGGSLKIQSEDLLARKDYFSELRTSDVSNLDRIQDSLQNAGMIDSAHIYLARAIYFEKSEYLMRAYQNYHAAWLALRTLNIPSPVVTAIFKQFLYRVGRFEEAEQLTDKTSLTLPKK